MESLRPTRLNGAASDAAWSRPVLPGVLQAPRADAGTPAASCQWWVCVRVHLLGWVRERPAKDRLWAQERAEATRA